MAKSKTEDHIALFIDCDNISHRSIEGIINELSKYGVVNIRQAYGNWTKDNLKNWEDKLLEFAIKPIQQFDYSKNKNAELEKRSAIKWVDKFPKNVPILMLHGNSDWRVKPEQSLNLALEFEKHRIPYRLIMFEGGDHGVTEFKKEVNQQVLKWFNSYLRDKKELPNMEYHGR